MSGNSAVLGCLAVIIILIVAWVAINVKLLRQMRQDHAAEALRHTSEGAEPAPDAGMPPHPSAADVSVEAVAEASASSEKVHSDAVSSSPEVYVDARETVFGSARPSFYLRQGADHPFHLPAWQSVMERLQESQGVLGWVAFHQGQVGASDHRYDSDLTDALRAHRETMERLRSEVGLSQVTESSMVGEEGKVWFFTGHDDVWFALFLEKSADVRTLMQDLLPSQVTAPLS
ncbi:hypothetical protein GCM10025857_34450 [Alicyclobacillus contaminans]|uniref:hypothetical protein n=1 Tax=Alicyclobacillus contaminans TaxID=392016 RepID=UPI000409D745|nr:hypothetical protein [Alicyclobacillus contaminans]GMA52088.1 hypothetical protein GCM10025857_34450 [Alicyclobacillus contaminans]